MFSRLPLLESRKWKRGGGRTGGLYLYSRLYLGNFYFYNTQGFVRCRGCKDQMTRYSLPLINTDEWGWDKVLMDIWVGNGQKCHQSQEQTEFHKRRISIRCEECRHSRPTPARSSLRAWVLSRSSLDALPFRVLCSWTWQSFPPQPLSHPTLWWA